MVIETAMLGACFSTAVAISTAINNVKMSGRIFVELNRRIDLLLKTLDEKYAKQELPEYMKDCIFELEMLLAEIAVYIKKCCKQNQMIKFLKNANTLQRIQAFETALNGLCQNLQIACNGWNDRTIVQANDEDMTELKTFIMAQFESQNLSLDQIISKLDIQSTQYVDTMEVLRLEQRKSAELGSSVMAQLASIQDQLRVRSGRTVSKREGITTINESDITFLQDDPIGSGSFGQVFVGTWHNQKVAIKMAIDTVNSDIVIGMLEAEAKLWFPLKHPNIIPLWGVSLNTDKPFLVMPFMQNGSVMDYLARNPTYTLYKRVKMMCDIAYGLVYLHSEKITHGDLKADNILVDENHTCKITDFGMATIKGATNASKKLDTGAIRFVAPERYIPGNRLNEASDVFAFGMTCYQILSGRVPYHEEHDDEVVKEYIKGGHFPTKIEFVPEKIWSILESSWGPVAVRPTFRTISQELAFALKTFPNAAKGDFADDGTPVPSGSTAVRSDGTLAQNVPSGYSVNYMASAPSEVSAVSSMPSNVRQVPFVSGQNRASVAAPTQQPYMDPRMASAPQHYLEKQPLPQGPHPGMASLPPQLPGYVSHQHPGMQSMPANHGYAHPGMPHMAQVQRQPTQTIVIQAPAPTPAPVTAPTPYYSTRIFGRFPQTITCNTCKQPTVTLTSTSAGAGAWALAGCLCFLGLCCCAPLPLMSENCKETKHNCGNCGAYAGAAKFLF